jgi:hypothetical protein
MAGAAAYCSWCRRAAAGDGWVKLPDDLELELRLNTDDTVSVTLGHRDPGEAFLAELATLAVATEATRSAPSTARPTGTVESPPAANVDRLNL